MPKSKRNKKVSLTKTKKKGIDHKKNLVKEIQDNIEKYKRLFVISVNNMRNSQLKNVRNEWQHSRFFFGKNKVMCLGLGRTKSEEYKENLWKVSDNLRGQMGLMFSNEGEKDVLKWFEDYSVVDFSRAGTIATNEIRLSAGLYATFSHSLEPQLRQLGLPTSLQKGIICLLKEHTVCKEGDLLTPEQSRILKYFDYKMSKFKVKIIAMWEKSSHKFVKFDINKDEEINNKKTKKSKPIIITASDLKEKTIEEEDEEEVEEGMEE